jgi:hypothetical protein
MISNKYTNKLLQYINNNYLEILNEININNIKKSKLINNLYSITYDTYKKNYNINFKISKLDKLHEQNEYPLMYIFFCKLQEHNILKNIFNIKLNNFKLFIEWYNNNLDNDFTYKIHKYFSKNNNINKEVYNLYLLIYKPYTKRKSLHNLLYDNNFISIDNQQHAETNKLIKYTYNNDNLNINIYMIDNNKNEINFNKIIHIIKIMKNISIKNKSHNNKLELVIFLGLQKKLLPNQENLYINCEHINSGASLPGSYVLIWRIEELYKVLIHELIHFYKLDFNSYDNNYNKLHNYIINKYNIHNTDSPNESYTEILALLIHSIFYSFYNKMDIIEILKYETVFTLVQISKILRYNNINNTNELGKKIIKQNTSIFSYYIVKGSLLVNLDKLIDFLNDEISNIKITNHIDRFYNLIIDCMNNKFFNLIDKSITILNNITKNNNFFNKTMRMTLFS